MIHSKSSSETLKSVIIIGLCLVVFATMALILNTEALKRFDLAIINVVQGIISTPLTTFMIAITFLGSVKGVIIVTLIFTIFLLIRRRYLLSLYLMISVAVGAGVLNRLIKALFHRERPGFLQLVSEHGYSFPSGHAMGSIILIGGITFVLNQLMGRRQATLFGLLISILLILIIGISRVYLGVHYPSDIIAGYALGGAWLVASIIVFKKVEKKHLKS